MGDLSNNREAISENHFHLEKRIDTEKYSETKLTSRAVRTVDQTHGLCPFKNSIQHIDYKYNRKHTINA